MSSHSREILGITSASPSVCVCVCPCVSVCLHGLYLLSESMHICMCVCAKAPALARPGLVAGVTKALEIMTLSRIVTVFSEAESRPTVCLTQQRTFAIHTVAGNASVKPAQSLSLRNKGSLSLEEGLRRGENLGRAQRATRRRQCPLSLAGPPLPLTGRQQGGRQASLPEEDRLTPWLGALFPKIPPCSPPTASFLRHQPWDLAGSRVLGTGLGVARAVRGPESWEASSPLAEAGPKR